MQPERDVDLWLTAKLDEPWSSEKIAPLLTKDILQAVATRFHLLDTSIKLKVLFSLVGIRKQNMKDLANNVKEVLNAAAKDDDEWVQTMSQLFTSVSDNKFNLDIHNANFEKTLNDICNKIKETGFKFNCLEDNYLNKDLLHITSAPVNTHFTLKKTHAIQPPSIKKTGLRASTDGLENIRSPVLSSVASKQKPLIPDKDDKKRPSIFAPKSHDQSSSQLGVHPPAERRGFQKKSRMQVIQISEVVEINKQKEQKVKEEKDSKKKRPKPEEQESHEELSSSSSSSLLPLPKPEKAPRKKKEKPEGEKKEPRRAKDRQLHSPVLGSSAEQITSPGLTSPQLPSEPSEDDNGPPAKRPSLAGQVTSPRMTQSPTMEMSQPQLAFQQLRRSSELLAKFPGLASGMLSPGGTSFTPASPQLGMSPPFKPNVNPIAATTVTGDQGIKLPGAVPLARVAPGQTTQFWPGLQALQPQAAAQTQESISQTMGRFQPMGGSLSSLLSQTLLPQATQPLQFPSLPQQTPLFTAQPQPLSTTLQPQQLSSPAGQPQPLQFQAQQLQQLHAKLQQHQQAKLAQQMPSLTPVNTNFAPQPTAAPVVTTAPSPASAAAPPAAVTTDMLFDAANRLTPEDQNLIVQFLKGNRVNPTPQQGEVKQILLNEQVVLDAATNKELMEQIVFELNYATGNWRKLRRKRVIQPLAQNA